jgi:hypothetical protein
MKVIAAAGPHVHYGMADDRIRVARLDLPDALPSGGIGAQPDGEV